MQFNCIYQELAENAEIIRSLTAGFSQAEATTKPSPESWSVLEVLYHLHDLECEDFRPRLKNLLDGNVEQWEVIDPKGWVEARSYNSRNFDEMRNTFLAERSKSLDWLQTLSSPDWEIEYSDDGGSMQAGHLFVSWAAHDNLHIRQLVELRRARIVSLATPYEVTYAGKW
jgi:hypothetical protein